MTRFTTLLFFLGVFCPVKYLFAQVKHNTTAKSITMAAPDGSLALTVGYSAGCVIRSLQLKGETLLSDSGACTGFRNEAGTATSAGITGAPAVSVQRNTVTLRGIRYGNSAMQVNETWRFTLSGNNITWDISRSYDRDGTLEETFFPQWNFASLSVWKGGIIDNGGMVWCKYLGQPGDTYGVHTGGVTFWNAASGDALQVRAHTGKAVAATFSHSGQHTFRFTQMASSAPLAQRYHLSRFVARKADVFAPFEVKKGTEKISIGLAYADYNQTYSRGTLPGIDAVAVRELMNTTGRYGVVDNNIAGANGWLTNWKCLHEPFFAQIGMALNDTNYTRNMSATLDQERDLAMLPDGRVLSRWHDVPGDEIAGTYNTQTGYYEAMWGYTIDSQTGYVINASEQFDLTGDVNWLRKHQLSCERALDWLIRRDANQNGIFEMMNNNIGEKKASDWLDIVWAGYENAFVNAQLYEALTLWAGCEKVLGNMQKATYYSTVAGRLKQAFNKPVEAGGFWSAAKQQYVYWRDNDGSVHGDNLVTPVNFAAIAFGLCDDPARIKQVLDQVEKRTAAEHLFHWPLCFDSFKREEVSGNNWPFPKYENGDIFPTWGYLGIRAYAAYDRAIALKYIHLLLKQYNVDGLSSQRYSRTTQTGLGDDILAGISTTITALYRDIYGVRPKWDRMGLDPHMSPELNGTAFSYRHKGVVYELALREDEYVMRSKGFEISSKVAFGAAFGQGKLNFYPYNKEEALLQVTEAAGRTVRLLAGEWGSDDSDWTITSPGDYSFVVKGLQAGAVYRLNVNGVLRSLQANTGGAVFFKQRVQQPVHFVLSK